MTFLSLGIFIVIVVLGLALLSYLLVAGAVIGFVLFAVFYIKNRFFSQASSTEKQQSPTGRVFDHDKLG